MANWALRAQRLAGAAVAAAASAAAAAACSPSPSSSSSALPSPDAWPILPPALPRTSTGVNARPAAGLLGCIGNTPLVEIESLTRATGRRIFAKAEHMNPGGSVKDRPAAAIIAAYEAEGKLVPRDSREPGDATEYRIVEGTGGNTGVGMALIAAARGYKATFTVPANVSQEKIDFARTLGAEVIVCPVVPFSDERHYYHLAKRLAESTPGAVWGNQFEGLTNSGSHAASTGPEIWTQCHGKVDGLALAAGTGGTIGGLSRFLLAKNPRLRVAVIDPPGSSLAAFVESGELRLAAHAGRAPDASKMAPQPGSTITEGIGIGRLTANFASSAGVDTAFRGTDADAVAMAYFLLRREGLYVGPSAALNVVGAVKLARELPVGSTVVTVLCDGGARYQSKLFSEAWLRERGLDDAAKLGVRLAEGEEGLQMPW